MGLYTTLPDSIKEVDVIVAGGGTAGCIVAARLAAADPKTSILVVEGGPNNDIPTVTYPALGLGNTLPTSKATIFYQGNKSHELAGRTPVVPSGGVLGGGSSINLMMYLRAQQSDFDSWDTPGWSSDDVLPFMNKLETYHGPGPKDRHGHDGPIHVSGGTYRVTRSEDDFIAVAGSFGWPELVDLSAVQGANNGVQRGLRFISPDGKRQDTASRYLHPLLQGGQHPNLHVLIESRVLRVLFEGTRASGVEFMANPDWVQSDVEGPTRVVKARRMVVVSCGACGTPPVLERSGIGDAEILKKAGVPLVADVPGVGRDYQDHQLIAMPYKSSLHPDETLDALLGGRLDPGALIQANDKILGWNAQDVTSKVRPTDAEVAALGPEFEEAWSRDFKDNLDRPLAMMTLLNFFPGDVSVLPPTQYFGISTFTAYPYSRGHIHITHASPAAPLDFETGFYSDARALDLKTHTWLYKKQREIARRMRIFGGEVAAGHPRFPARSAAACVEEGPLEGEVRDIVYTAADDAALEAWLRENVGTTWHSLGTCKMGPRGEGGVVDARLGVYGVQGLKVADLSVVPRNVAANTANTAMVVGEKAAAMFIEELGLGGSSGLGR